MKIIKLLVCSLSVLVSANTAFARDRIHIVGSSTVFPFVTAVAEKFGKNKNNKTPVVESTGTGGGFKLFCDGVGDKYPDLINASRQIKPSELELCEKNKIGKISEIVIGYDGITLANAKKSAPMTITNQQLFLSLARQVPQNGKLVPNHYKKWSDIDSSLPKEVIAVYGTPPTSGTRDTFVEIVMEKACAAIPEFHKEYPNEQDLKKNCGQIREDGAYIEAGENGNLIVQKLLTNPKAFGIFGYSFLETNEKNIQAAKIDGIYPSFENINNGRYPISRSLYVYVKNAHIDKTAGLVEFLEELTSVKALGEDGYLGMIGLITLPEEKQKIMRDKVQNLKNKG